MTFQPLKIAADRVVEQVARNRASFVKLYDMANRCIYSGAQSDVANLELEICERFACWPEHIEWKEDDAGTEWLWVKGDLVGRLQQVTR